MNPFIHIATEAARLAGRIIIKASERLDLIKISQKAQQEIVTNVDHEAEQKIIQTIRKAYPDHAILAEESGKLGENDITWIIDPLDGTRNFIHGFPHYAISIAVQVKNRLEHGVIYDPLRDELFVASLGRGAQLNGYKIRCKAQSTVNGAFLGISHLNHGTGRLASLAVHALQGASLRQAGAAALDLAYVAAGRLEGFLAEDLQLWDYAAGLVLVREAGALVSDFTGQESLVMQGQILTAHPKLLKVLLQQLAR